MKPNTHKKCGGKFDRKNENEKHIYTCNRCGKSKIKYKKIKQ